MLSCHTLQGIYYCHLFKFDLSSSWLSSNSDTGCIVWKTESAVKNPTGIVVIWSFTADEDSTNNLRRRSRQWLYHFYINLSKNTKRKYIFPNTEFVNLQFVTWMCNFVTLLLSCCACPKIGWRCDDTNSWLERETILMFFEWVTQTALTIPNGSPWADSGHWLTNLSCSFVWCLVLRWKWYLVLQKSLNIHRFLHYSFSSYRILICVFFFYHTLHLSSPFLFLAAHSFTFYYGSFTTCSPAIEAVSAFHTLYTVVLLFTFT